mmetsp:Transcript_3338/g.4980  ORF Transcript_3338/g.4980 Transcript_3338/m.4980 type:complete len:264 (+) Transcript_3338:89-880(+)
MGLRKDQHKHINRVSFTEEDFMDTKSRGHLFTKNSSEEHIPPADINVFDQSPDDIRLAGFDCPRSGIHYDWAHESLPTGLTFDKSMFDDDDAIRIPSLDSNLKWSPQNPMVTLPNIGHTTLARAVSSGEASIHGAQLSILEELKRMTHQQTLKPDKPTDWIAEAEITDMDVICERGGKSNRHDGTKRYRGMIEKYKPEYQSLTAKTAKTNLSRKIIFQIQKDGGRFLKKDEQSGQYFVLSPVETTKKVSQAMREKKALKWTAK